MGRIIMQFLTGRNNGSLHVEGEDQRPGTGRLELELQLELAENDAGGEIMWNIRGTRSGRADQANHESITFIEMLYCCTNRPE